MIAKQEALQKIRHQIKLAEGYRIDSPDWQGAIEMLKVLRKRELELANQLQADIFKAELERMNHVTVCD